MWIEPLDPDPPGDAGPPTRLLVYTTEDDLVMDGREPAPILVEDGEVVGPLDPGEVEALVRVPPGWTTMRLRLDGQAHTLCRPSPIDFGDDEGSCPDGLVLRDADGVALARADTDLLPDHDPSMTWRATDVGLLVLEPETVRLRRWTDLSEAWSLAVPGPWRVLPTVDPSASGVAIATPSSTPPRVTFHG
jgi:hypothetical protein